MNETAATVASALILAVAAGYAGRPDEPCETARRRDRQVNARAPSGERRRAQRGNRASKRC
jgi:hypothetical protein